VRVAGYNIPANPSRREIQQLLDATRGKPAAHAVHLAVLKTLTKAEYAPALIGHFALASEHYLHFTSPIRRYPDLTAHRALEALFEAAGFGKPLPRDHQSRRRIADALRDDDRCPDEAALAEVARHCTLTEQNAESAERELRDLLVLQLMAQHVGETFGGTITGVMSFGVFVQLDKYLVEGMIRTVDLPGAPAERWRINESTGSMTAQRSGRAISIGMQFDVRIVKVDLARREMDLQIVADSLKRTAKAAPRRDNAQPRVKHKRAKRDRRKGGRRR
jgi:ribonuclease R